MDHWNGFDDAFRGFLSPGSRLPFSWHVEDSITDRDAVELDLPELGVGLPSIREAARIVACNVGRDRGTSDTASLDDLEGEAIGLLVEAVESGDIRPLRVRRDEFGGERDLDRTVIDVRDLARWMLEHGIRLDGAFDEYVTRELHIRVQAIAEIRSLRALYEQDPHSFVAALDERWALVEPQKTTLLRAVQCALTNLLGVQQENVRLRARIRELGDDPSEPPVAPRITPKERSSLLKIIGAFCLHAGIDPGDADATGKVKRLIERQIHDGPGEDTVRKHVKAAATALRDTGNL